MNKITGCGCRDPLTGAIRDIISCNICSEEDNPGECSRFRRECRREQIKQE
ncbi:MAG: hypothetical protein [Methanosarcina spindle-shaped virus 1]